MLDDKTTARSLVFGLPQLNGTVDEVAVGSSREGKEKRGQADEDIEKGAERSLQALYTDRRTDERGLKGMSARTEEQANPVKGGFQLEFLRPDRRVMTFSSHLFHRQ